MSIANIHTPASVVSSLLTYSSEISGKESTSDLLNNTNLNAVVNDNEVLLELQGDIPYNNGVYEVYRDNIYLDSFEGNSFVDNEVEYGKTYEYKVLSRTELKEVEKQEIENYLKEQNIQLTDSQHKKFIINLLKCIGWLIFLKMFQQD